MTAVMTRFNIQRHLFARATAWFLIFICAWMGTDGVLHHTEAGLSSHAAAASVHHLTASVPADTCAACEWTQGMQTGTLVVCRVPFPLFALQSISALLVRRLSPRVLLRSSPRAPPFLVTS